MLSFKTSDKPAREVFSYMLGAIAPRPIALVGTISPSGKNNLAPFSFFNGFGSNPPMLGFSAATSARTGQKKDTYHNIMHQRECTIQVVTYKMVEQVNLASTENPDIDEFETSGLTAIPSDLVKAPRCKESPVQFECILKDMIHLGEGGGAGNLALCEIVKIHVDESVLTDGIIDPTKIDLVGRNGGEYYTRASGAALFSIARPAGTNIVGFNGLPDALKNSTILTGNELGQLANCTVWPSFEDIQNLNESCKTSPEPLQQALRVAGKNIRQLETLVQLALRQNQVSFARLVAAKRALVNA